jgi:hypothetical protein
MNPQQFGVMWILPRVLGVPRVMLNFFQYSKDLLIVGCGF